MTRAMAARRPGWFSMAMVSWRFIAYCIRVRLCDPTGDAPGAARRGSTPSGSGRSGLPLSVPLVLARAVDQLHEGHGRPIPGRKPHFKMRR